MLASLFTDFLRLLCGVFELLLLLQLSLPLLFLPLQLLSSLLLLLPLLRPSDLSDRFLFT
jgi:hypothetical protein